MNLDLLQIRIPNPYFEGDSNAYLLEVSPNELALIDTGIGTDEAFAHFKNQIESHGYRIRNISTILLTHKHSDHFGMAHKIQEISGATVYVHEDDWNDVVHYSERRDEVAELYHRTMLFWGIPPTGIEKFSWMRKSFDTLAQSVPAEKLRDGERLQLPRVTVFVVHTPGHTQGSSCFVTDAHIFTGDHLLPHYTPNVGATDISVGKMLKKFLISLEKIRQYSALDALPGHLHPMENFSPRIDRILEHHKIRETKILQILSGDKPKTIFEIAQALFGTMRDHHLLLGCGEVHAHLELLQDESKVVIREENQFLRS
jgi:hydroxyacylglutathione hydrolase